MKEGHPSDLEFAMPSECEGLAHQLEFKVQISFQLTVDNVGMTFISMTRFIFSI